MSLKRLLPVLVLFGLALPGRAFSLVGDVNLNGEITQDDSNLIANFLVGNVSTLPSLENADVNHDGKVDVVDALFILQFVKGLRPNLGGAPPQVLGVIPLDQSTDVPVTVPINVFFSNPISSVTVTPGTVTLLDSTTNGAVPVNFAFSQQNLILTVTSQSPLVNNRTYQVVVSTSVKDKAGNPLPSSFSSRFTTAALGSLRIFSGQNQQGPISSLLTQGLVAQALDAHNNPLPKTNLTFQADQGNGALYPSNTRKIDIPTDSSGQASIQWTLGNQASTQTVIVSAPGFANSLTFSARALSAQAVSLRITMGSNQNCATGQPVPMPLMLRAMDAGGNPVQGTTVTYSVMMGGGNFRGQPTFTVVSDTMGAVGTGFTCGSSSGSIMVQGTFPGMVGQPPVFTFEAMIPRVATTAVVGTVINTDVKPLDKIHVFIASNPGIQAFTDASGAFRLQPVPPGMQRLIIDASHSNTSDGDQYADLAFDLMVVQGQDNTIQMPAILPEIDPQSSLSVSDVQGGTLTLRANPVWKLVVNPGQATFPGGTHTGTLHVTFVPTDKIPMPPADGKYSNVFVAVEPPGVKFSPTAQVTFPNLDNQTPGTIVNIVSFDHDTGMFTPIGKGKVSEDGKTVTSLPGQGLIHGGWHYAEPVVPSPTTNLNGSAPNCHSTISSSGISAELSQTGNFSLPGIPMPAPGPGPGTGGVGGTLSCLDDEGLTKLGPPGDCDQSKYERLNNAVDVACNPPNNPQRCEINQDCPTLRDNAAKQMACSLARYKREKECFRGGDKGHREAYNNAAAGYWRCFFFIIAKQCP